VSQLQTFSLQRGKKRKISKQRNVGTILPASAICPPDSVSVSTTRSNLTEGSLDEQADKNVWDYKSDDDEDEEYLWYYDVEQGEESDELDELADNIEICEADNFTINSLSNISWFRRERQAC
jgi:hypothetical protein